MTDAMVGWVLLTSIIGGVTSMESNVFSALSLKTEFLLSADGNLGDSWTARVSGRSRVASPSLVSIILYLYNEGDGAMDLQATTRNTVEEIFGHSSQVSLGTWAVGGDEEVVWREVG